MPEDDVDATSTSDSVVIAENDGSGIAQKSRSCRGCLLYSSSLRDNGRNPICIGLSRTEPHVYSMMGEPERDAVKNGRRLADFKYACIGYSIHNENKGASPGRPIEGAELPLCLGVEFLADRRPQAAAPAQDQEGPPIMPRPPSSIRPPTTISGISGDEFASRFFRCAGLVASAVGRNLSHMVSSVKSGLDDIYHDRRRPK